jgi:sarcosine oxidase
MLTAADIQRRFPLLRPQAGHVGLLEYKAGILVPEQCVATHIDLASRHGAELRLHEAVETWDAGPNHITARTSRGTYEAGALVITAGPWAGRVLHDLDLPLRVERVVQYWFEPRDRVEEFARLPIYGWDDGGVYAYGFPYLRGQGLKCAFHQAFQEVTTPQAIRREVAEEETARMRAHLARFMPDAAGTLLATATCMYTNTPDHHFIIDRHPAYRNVALACGFSGHGFKFCGVVGEALADLALAGETKQPIDFFALSRFKSTVR